MADGTDGNNLLNGRSPIKATQDILDAMIQDTDGSDKDDEADGLDLKGIDNSEDEIDGQDTDPNDESDDSDEDDEGAKGTGEEVEIDSSTLAQLLGISEDDILTDKDGNVMFRAKVDGQDKEISFDSLLRNYRLQQHVDNNATQVKQEREAVVKERELMRNAYISAIQQTATYITSQEEQLVKEFNSIDWQTKQKENPTQYLIDREGFKERLQQLQAKRLELGQKWEEEQNKAKQEFQKVMEERVTFEAKSIKEKIPEWENTEVAKAESAALKAYAKDQGFTDEELSSLIDHRAWFMLRKAMLYDQSIGKVKNTMKKVVNLPKVTKNKAPVDSGAVKKVRLGKMKEAAKSGGRNAEAAFVNELLKTNRG
jgi:hypothetical protein